MVRQTASPPSASLDTAVPPVVALQEPTPPQSVPASPQIASDEDVERILSPKTTRHSRAGEATAARVRPAVNISVGETATSVLEDVTASAVEEPALPPLETPITPTGERQASQPTVEAEQPLPVPVVIESSLSRLSADLSDSSQPRQPGPQPPTIAVDSRPVIFSADLSNSSQPGQSRQQRSVKVEEGALLGLHS
jgi:hypothetical protein